jgi:hypothetical protein
MLIDTQQQFRLAVTDDHARDTVAAAVDAALAAQPSAPQLTVYVTGDGLPAPVVAALVAGLRRLREVGGALIVIPETPAVRDALALHGLDRVFALPIGVESPAPRRGGPRSWQPGRIAAAALAAMLFACAAWTPAQAQSPSPTAVDGISNDAALILERVIARNPELASFQGRMHVDVRLTSFPFFREHLDATTYYKRPSNYEVVFDHLPSYARGFEKLYTDVGDPSQWAKHFTITYTGETAYHDRTDLTLRLVQRVRGMIDHETVLVDPESFTIDQIRYDYYNGGHITMSQSFRPVGPYLLLATQSAEIAIPHVHAIASGSYDGYRTNVALDDAVFARNN